MNGGGYSGTRTGHPYQNDPKSCVDWSHLVKHRVQLCSSVAMVMKFEVL
jgi:hypothetical protein